MPVSLIFIAEDGTPVTLSFSLNTHLDGLYYGVWEETTNDIQLSTEAWQYYQDNKKNLRALKPLMDRLHKYTGISFAQAKNTFEGLVNYMQRRGMILE